MSQLNRKIGEVDFDGLITDLNPPVEVRGRTIAKLPASRTLPRGTILARSAGNGKLYILGSVAGQDDTLTPDCVLCDDTVVGTDSDINAAVYTAGCFHTGKVTVEDAHTIAQAEFDALRTRNIVFRLPHEAL